MRPRAISAATSRSRAVSSASQRRARPGPSWSNSSAATAVGQMVSPRAAPASGADDVGERLRRRDEGAHAERRGGDHHGRPDRQDEAEHRRQRRGRPQAGQAGRGAFVELDHEHVGSAHSQGGVRRRGWPPYACLGIRPAHRRDDSIPQEPYVADDEDLAHKTGRGDAKRASGGAVRQAGSGPVSEGLRRIDVKFCRTTRRWPWQPLLPLRRTRRACGQNDGPRRDCDRRHELVCIGLAERPRVPLRARAPQGCPRPDVGGRLDAGQQGEARCRSPGWVR